MRNNLIKSIETNCLVEIIYLSKDGEISKRRIKVLQVEEDLFKAYCYLRKSSRTFRVDNILALVPITSREHVVL